MQNDSGSDLAVPVADRVPQVTSENSVTQSSKYPENIYICYNWWTKILAFSPIKTRWLSKLDKFPNNFFLPTKLLSTIRLVTVRVAILSYADSLIRTLFCNQTPSSRSSIKTMPLSQKTFCSEGNFSASLLPWRKNLVTTFLEQSQSTTSSRFLISWSCQSPSLLYPSMCTFFAGTSRSWKLTYVPWWRRTRTLLHGCQAKTILTDLEKFAK